MDGTAVGTGKQNTSDIVAALGLGAYAAKICDDLTVSNGGVTYTDWFLPSKDELDLMYDNLQSFAVGGFAYAYYWSSSESDSYNAWNHGFGTGGLQYYYNKGNYRRVRAF